MFADRFEFDLFDIVSFQHSWQRRRARLLRVERLGERLFVYARRSTDRSERDQIVSSLRTRLVVIVDSTRLENQFRRHRLDDSTDSVASNERRVRARIRRLEVGATTQRRRLISSVVVFSDSLRVFCSLFAFSVKEILFDSFHLLICARASREQHKTMVQRAADCRFSFHIESFRDEDFFPKDVVQVEIYLALSSVEVRRSAEFGQKQAERNSSRPVEF